MKAWLVSLCIAAWSTQVWAEKDGFDFAGANAVCWTSLGTNENDSMPVGNGDLAANVWTEQNGDLVLLLAKADAWMGNAQLAKVGRLRVRLSPNPFVGSRRFSQTLRLQDGSLQLQSGRDRARLWVDANQPALRLEVHLARPGQLQASLELWRKNRSWPAAAAAGTLADNADSIADFVLPAGSNRLAWCHFNRSSMYPEVLRQQHLEALLDKYADPFLHRCFGASLGGPGLVAADERTLRSRTPQRDFVLTLVALTRTNAASVPDWQSNVLALAGQLESQKLKAAWAAHQAWWKAFWNRSWVQVAGSAEAAQVSRGYALQRYMVACSSRGAYPVKFNGGLFTVGHDLQEKARASATNHDPDYRAWGECYWNQNNRLPYWPLLASGDYDLLKPWFAMYLAALPLAKDRTRLYYQHDGASFPETMYFFGLPRMGDFGHNNPSTRIQSEWQRYHIQGSLEVVAQMLDYYEHTGDTNFVKGALVPFADAIVTFFDQHYPRTEGGQLRLAPAQSLETYQLVAVNPTPDLAGLRADIPRLLALPPDLTTETQRAAWAKTFQDLPPIPLGRTTAKGKIPPLAKGDPNGLPTILPAQEYGPTHNSENPELYVAFPYRLYGVGKPGLELARTAYAARRSPQKTCWGQDGPQASVLGLTEEAQKSVVSEFTNYGDQRFCWFWKPAHDWIPDLDNGGDGMITLQQMLLQCDGRRLLLLPAWPTNWTADFKLHAPFNTTVEGHVEKGKVSHLRVTPPGREAQVERQ